MWGVQKPDLRSVCVQTHQEPCPKEASNDQLHFSDGLCSHKMLCWRVSLILGGYAKHQATACVGLGSLLSLRVGAPTARAVT